MDATDQATLLSSIALMKELKALIIDSAPALFTPQYPTAHVYSVVISKTPSGTSGTSFEYNARLVLCTGPERALHSEGVVLLVNGCLCESPVDALADLLEVVYERARREWGGIGEGESVARED